MLSCRRQCFQLILLLPNHLVHRTDYNQEFSFRFRYVQNKFFQYIIFGTFSILEVRQRSLGICLKMSQPEKPTRAKTMSTLRYVIEVKASKGNISQSILRDFSQSNVKYHFVFAKFLEVLSPRANVQGKISEKDTEEISFETRLSNQIYIYKWRRPVGFHPIFKLKPALT